MSEPRRITLIISSLSGGGAERVMSILASEWARQGRDVCLFSLDDGNGPNPYDIHPAVRYVPLNVASRENNPVYDPRNFTRLLRLRRAVQRSRPDVVLSFSDKTNVTVLLSLFGAGLKIVVSERVHPAHYPIGFVWNTLRLITYTFARRIVIQTRGVADFFPGRLRRKMTIVPNPVVEPPASAQKILRSKQRREPVVVGLGRLDHQKGFDVLITAFRLLRSQAASEWKLRIYGEGPRRGDLEAAAGDDPRVELPGWQPNVHEILAGSAIFVLSSRFEGFPNVLCEAMACGAAVIATDCPDGPAEIVTPEHDGLLIPVDDAEALAVALARLMSDDGLRERLGRNAQDIVQRLGVQQVMQRWTTALSV